MTPSAQPSNSGSESYWRNVAETYQNLYEFEQADHYITRQLLSETRDDWTVENPADRIKKAKQAREMGRKLRIGVKSWWDWRRP